MPNYMTQKMSSGTLIPITYYRKQSSEHVSHTESRNFTNAAKSNYAVFNHINEDQVEVGDYDSGQGVPIAGKTYQI